MKASLTFGPGRGTAPDGERSITRQTRPPRKRFGRDELDVARTRSGCLTPGACTSGPRPVHPHQRTSLTCAFVLSGGASLGAIEVGVLQALFEPGIAPDLIIGTSAGALNGAFIASREPTVTTPSSSARSRGGCASARSSPPIPWRG